MIKNQMTLPLGIDTQYIKSTGGVFTTATDAEILPYTIGYIPFSMLDKARIFKNVGKYTNTSVPNVSFRTIRQSTLYEPTKGVPFVYTIKTIQENQNFHGFYDTAGNTWNTSFIGSTNTSLRALHSYNTEHFVNESGNNGLNVTGLRLVFVLYETLGNGGWGGTSPQTVADKTRVSVSATFSAVSPDIVLSFSASVSSSFGSHTYTIDNSIFNAMDENGVFQIDGGTYSSGGSDFERHLFGAIEQVYVETSGQNLATNTPGFGAVIAENFRNTQTLTEQNHTNVRNTYGTQSTNYLVSANECMYLFDSKNGYFWEYVENNVSLFRFAVANWINCPMFCGATWSDILICICTALPAYKINNDWYVAEFTDDYYITGKLIPYANAREWQTFINPDNNTFDYNDIPEPGPEPSDDIHGRHTGSTGGLFGSGVGAVSNFVTHWVLDASQVQTFGSHLWKDLLDFDAQGEPIGTQLWKNAKIAVNTYFQTGSFDPGSILELLIGLRYFPINLAKADYATQMTVPAVYFGTGRVGVNVTTNPWKLNDCGIYITGGDMDLSQLSWNKYDDWRDVYNVSASIYIPFCGTYELPWSDIYNGTLHLSYGVDVLSGALTAFVECTLGMSRFLVCVGSGMVGFEVPITATNANRINAAILGDMGNMMGTLFNPSDAAKLTSSLVGAETGSSAGIPAGDSDPTATNAAGSAPIVGQAALAGRVAEIHAGIASRPGITCPAIPGGRGWGALTGQRIPFITVRKGRYVEGTGYGHAAGYPRMKIESIGNISGYTQCINPDLSGINCTKAERDMLKQILETGFYA